MLKRPKLLLAVILLLGGAGGALAQAVVQQYGTVTAGHLAMFLSNGRVVDAGGSQGAGMAPANSALAGTRPTGLGIVNSGLGQCQFSSYATGSYYNTLCSGFDASGNPSVQAGRVGSGTALPLSLPNAARLFSTFFRAPARDVLNWSPILRWVRGNPAGQLRG